MKKLIIGLLTAALCHAAAAEGELVPDARWDDFSKLTSGNYTLSVDGSCTVANGVLTIGTAGASVSGAPKGKKFTVIAEVSDCPESDKRVALLNVYRIFLTTGQGGMGQQWDGNGYWPSTGCDGKPLDAGRHVVAMAYSGQEHTRSYVDGELRVAYNGNLTGDEMNAIGLAETRVLNINTSLAKPTGMKVYHLALFNRCLSDEEVAAFEFEPPTPTFTAAQTGVSADSATFKLKCALLGKGASSATVYKALALADEEYPAETVVATGVTVGWSATEVLENLTEGTAYKVRFRIVNDQDKETVVEEVFTHIVPPMLDVSTSYFGDNSMSFKVDCPSTGSGASSAQVYEMHALATGNYPAEWTLVTDTVTAGWSDTFELSELTPGSSYKIKFRIVNDQDAEVVTDEILFTTALARWDDFSADNLTRCGCTLSVDTSCSVDADGALTIGTDGAQMSYGKKLFTIIADVSGCPVSSDRLDVIGSDFISLTTEPDGMKQLWVASGVFWGKGAVDSALDSGRHVIVLSYNGTDQIKPTDVSSYVDGVKVVTQNSKLSNNPVGSLYFGKAVTGALAPTGMKIHHLAIYQTNLPQTEVAAFFFEAAAAEPTVSVTRSALTSDSASFKLKCTHLGKGASSATVYRALALADGEYPAETVVASDITAGWSATEVLENLTEGTEYKVRFRIVNDQNSETVVEEVFTPFPPLEISASTAYFGDDSMSFALDCPSIGSGAAAAQVYEMHALTTGSYPAEWTPVASDVTSDWSHTFKLSDLTPGSSYKIKFRIVNDQDAEAVTDEILFTTALARWDDFSEDNRERCGLTLSVDASCSVGADGVLTIGTDGLSVNYSGVPYTIIADVSDCPTEGCRSLLGGLQSNGGICLTTDPDGLKQMWWTDNRNFGNGGPETALDSGRHIVVLAYNAQDKNKGMTSSYVDGQRLVHNEGYLSGSPNDKGLNVGCAAKRSVAPTGMKVYNLAVFNRYLSETEVAAFFFEAAAAEPTVSVTRSALTPVSASFAVSCPALGGSATSARVYSALAPADGVYPEETLVASDITAGWSTTLSFDELTPATAYKLKVRVVNNKNGEKTSEATFTTLAGTWETGTYDPVAWTPLLPEGNALFGRVAVLDGVGYSENGRTSADPAVLTDGAVPKDDAYAGQRLFGVASNDALEWTFDRPESIASLAVYSRWGDAGRDQINIAKIQVKYEADGDYVDLPAAVVNANSGSGANFAKLSFDGRPIAKDIYALKVVFDVLENNGVGYAEIEAERHFGDSTDVVVGAVGYAGLADGQGHGIGVTVLNPAGGEGCTYSWSTDNVTWTEPAATQVGAPTFSEAGSHTVWCKVAAAGYETAVVSGTVVIYGASATWTYADGAVRTISDGIWTLNVAETDKKLTVTGIGSVLDLAVVPPLDLSKSVSDGYSIVAIGDSAFKQRSDLMTVTLPDTLQTIGTEAFRDCTMLESVTPFLPPSVTSIGIRAFYGCSNLTGDLTVGEAGGTPTQLVGGWTTDGKEFSGCSKITSARLLSATNIPYGTFFTCTSLTNLVLGAAETIETWAFQGCSSLKTVRLSNTLKSIGDRAFQSCTALETVEPLLPETVRDIGSSAFDGCNKLHGDLVLGKRRKPLALGTYAFSHADALTSITVNGKVSSIPDAAFIETKAARTVTVMTANPFSLAWAAVATGNGLGVRDFYVNGFVTGWGDKCFKATSYLLRLWLAKGNADWDDWIAENVTPWDELDQGVKDTYTNKFPNEETPVGLVKADSPAVAVRLQWVFRWNPPKLGFAVIVK